MFVDLLGGVLGTDMSGFLTFRTFVLIRCLYYVVQILTVHVYT